MTKSRSDAMYGTFLLLMALAVVAGLLVGAKVVVPRFEREGKVENPKKVQKKIRVGEVELMVEVRDDDAERELGLSGREGLGDNEGMVFVFSESQRPLFWMKDMLFDIDMIWISEGEIMQIDEYVPAPTVEEPRNQTRIPSMPINMVLEVKAGWVGVNEVVVGDMVEFDDNNVIRKLGN